MASRRNLRGVSERVKLICLLGEQAAIRQHDLPTVGPSCPVAGVPTEPAEARLAKYHLPRHRRLRLLVHRRLPSLTLPSHSIACPAGSLTLLPSDLPLTHDPLPSSCDTAWLPVCVFRWPLARPRKLP